MNKLKYHFLGGLVFLGTIVFGYIGYTAYNSLATQTDGATITKDIWNDVINKVNTIGTGLDTLQTQFSLSSIPTGAVMSFNLDSCPTGWSVLASANGRVIVGIGSDGQGNTYTRGITGGEAKHTLTISEIPSHTHQEHYTGGSPTRSLSRIGVHSTTNSAGNIPGIFTEPTGGNSPHENRQPYLALLYCIKN